MPFLPICHCQLPLLIFLASSWYQKAKVAPQKSLRNKEKLINFHFKGLCKTNCYKEKLSFSRFFFSDWLLYECVFSFLIKAFVNFEKLIRFHWQAFIVYKNGENLKILIEIFCQKLIVSNVILAFLDHLKLKMFFVSQSVADIECLSFSKSLDPPLNMYLISYCIIFETNKHIYRNGYLIGCWL